MRNIKDYLIVSYWCLRDYLLALKCWLINEDHIGRYVHVMTPSEIRVMFGENVVGGGYNGYVIIKVFLQKEWYSFNTVLSILNHEVLHQALRGIARERLDSVHKLKQTKKGVVMEFDI